MADTIIKPSPVEDFYVVHSSIVDSPTCWGTRRDLEAGYEYASAERFARADAQGTSARFGDPPFLGWNTTDILVREGVVDATRPERAWSGYVRRPDLRAFCETLGADGDFHPAPGMVRWEVADDDDAC